MKICSIDGCDRKVKARGLCPNHYYKLRKYGDPTAGITYGIDMADRFKAKVRQDASGCHVWTASTNSDGYATFWTGPGRSDRVAAHRFAYEQANGPIPTGMDIDHMCWNRACVNPEHLRAVTHKQNLENMCGLTSSNTSGYRGVSWSKYHRKWSAYLYHHGKRVNAGLFPTAEQANEAIVRLRVEMFTHNDLDRAESPSGL